MVEKTFPDQLVFLIGSYPHEPNYLNQTHKTNLYKQDGNGKPTGEERAEDL